VITLDPVNQYNNTTRSSFNIQKVLQVFAWAHQEISEKLNNGTQEILREIF